MRDIQGQDNSFNAIDIWSTVTSEIWAVQTETKADLPLPSAKPKPQPEAPLSPSGPEEKTSGPAKTAPNDAATAPKEKPQPKPQPKPIVDYPIPAPGGKPLAIDELVLGQKNERGEFTSKDHGLGSDQYQEREAAEKALISLGVKSLPMIERILFGASDGDKLTKAEESAREDPEVMRRLERIYMSIQNDLPRLIRDLSSKDRAVSKEAKAILGAMPVANLVHLIATNRDSLTDEQFKTIGKFVHPRLSERMLMADYGIRGDWSRTANPADLSRSLAVYEILGLPLEPIQARLAYSLLKSGGAQDIKKATELLAKLDGPNTVDDETAVCRDVCRAILAIRGGKVEDGLTSLEAVVEKSSLKDDEGKYIDGPALAKACDDLNWLVFTGKIHLDAKQKARLSAVSESVSVFRRSGISEALKLLGK